MQCTNHKYVKTLDKTGMYFIDMCHTCLDKKPYISDESILRQLIEPVLGNWCLSNVCNPEKW
jgi:hypothetical protein